MIFRIHYIIVILLCAGHAIHTDRADKLKQPHVAGAAGILHHIIKRI